MVWIVIVGILAALSVFGSHVLAASFGVIDDGMAMLVCFSGSLLLAVSSTALLVVLGSLIGG